MSGLGCRARLAFGTRRRNFAKASLGSFKDNPRLRLGLTLNSPRLALYERYATAYRAFPPRRATMHTFHSLFHLTPFLLEQCEIGPSPPTTTTINTTGFHSMNGSGSPLNPHK